MSSTTSRRGFLQAGFCGGIGLTLADFFRMRQAQADQKFYESKEGTAKNVIYIYLPEVVHIRRHGTQSPSPQLSIAAP